MASAVAPKRISPASVMNNASFGWSVMELQVAFLLKAARMKLTF